MTTRTPTRSSTRGAPGTLVTRDQLEWWVPGLLDALAERFDFGDELAELRWPRWITPAPSTKSRAAGTYFDPDAVMRVIAFAKLLPHTKGRRWGGTPFVPDLWQVIFVLGPVFGWKRADGSRVYRTLFLEVPRKNGKSTLCAIIALYLLCADGEPGAEVISAAKDRNQAKAVFSVAADMVVKSPKVRRIVKVIPASHRMVRESTGSTYVAISSDKGGAAKHGLNLHGGIVDELHVITDRELIGTIETSTGSRDQPLLVFITTAGTEESSVWQDKHDLVVKWSQRTVHDDALWGVIYAGDEAEAKRGGWRTPHCWRDANPGYGRSLLPDYLQQASARAESTPAELNRFLRLHLNVATESAAGWLPLVTWDRSASVVIPEDLRGARCFGGLDLASSLDLSSLVLVFPDDEDETLDVLPYFWTPADTLAGRAHRDRADYETWAREGLLTATPGEAIDYDVVEADIVTLGELFDIRAINYDPWGAKQLHDHLRAHGARMYETRQGYASLSPPMREVERLVVERKLRHGGHPVLRFCVTNTRTAQDPAGNIKPDRARSRGRIDGVVALIMAIDAWTRSLGGGRSIYEDRGLEVV